MEAEEKEKLNQVFGKVIEDLRLAANITQAELAERGEFNRTYISDLERGLKQPSLSTIVRLSYAFDIKPSELLQQVESLIEIN